MAVSYTVGKPVKKIFKKCLKKSTCPSRFLPHLKSFPDLKMVENNPEPKNISNYTFQ